MRPRINLFPYSLEAGSTVASILEMTSGTRADVASGVQVYLLDYTCIRSQSPP